MMDLRYDSHKIVAATARGISAKIAYRTDMRLADFQANGDTARILIGYTARRGAPSGSDVRAFVEKGLGTGVFPLAETIKNHQEINAVSLIITKNRERKDISERQRMASVGGDRYIEASTNHTWELENSPNGPALFRTGGTDLHTLLRSKKAQDLSHKRVSLRSVMASEGSPVALQGTQVQYVEKVTGEIYVGKVTAQADQAGKMMVLRTGATEAEEIASLQVLKVIAMDEEMMHYKEGSGDAYKDKLEAYYTKAFGDAEYARKLVRGTGSMSGSSSEIQAFLATAGLDRDNVALFLNETRKASGNPRCMVIAAGVCEHQVVGMFTGTGYEWLIKLP